MEELSNGTYNNAGDQCALDGTGTSLCWSGYTFNGRQLDWYNLHGDYIHGC